MGTHPLSVSVIGVTERGVVRVEDVVISDVVSVIWSMVGVTKLEGVVCLVTTGVVKLGVVVSTSDCIGSYILTRDSYKQAPPA